MQRDWVNKERWWIQDKKVLGRIPQCWSCVSMSANFSIPYCLRPPSHNGYLVHRSKIGSTAAGCHRHPLTGRVNCWLSYIYAQTFTWIPSPLPSQGTCRFYVFAYSCFVVNSYSASHNNWCTATLLNRIITAQWEGMGDVGSARYEPALLPPCLTIRVLCYVQ